MKETVGGDGGRQTFGRAEETVGGLKNAKSARPRENDCPLKGTCISSVQVKIFCNEIYCT